MGIQFGDRIIALLLQTLLLCSKSVEQQDCNGENIDFQCHTFRLDVQTWSSADESCARGLSVAGLMGAHLTSIRSADKQSHINAFMDRFGLEGAWIGATNRPLLWQWLSNQQVIQSQGCYKDDPKNRAFSYSAQIAGLSSEGCIDACRIAGYGYAGIQAGSTCMCANTLNSNALATGCINSCAVTTPLSSWCGGPELLTTVYKIGGANGQWGYNQPDITPTQKSCAVLDMGLESKMADEDCGLRYDYMCQINTTTCTGYGYQQLSFLCYYVSDFKSQSERVDWNTAVNKCVEMGGVLATVDNYILQLAIRNWLASFYPNQNRKIWIGAFKGGWYWLSGYSFSYTNWAPGEPKKDSGDQCAFVDQKLGYKWLALPCNTSKVFICQRGYDTFTTPYFIWSGTTPAIPQPSTSIGGVGSTSDNDRTGSSISSTSSTRSSVFGSTTDKTGSTRGGNTPVGISSTQTPITIKWSSTSPFIDLAENSTGAQSPSVAESTQNKAGWSNLAIGLFALLAVILFLLLLLGLIFLALCIAKNRAGGNKVGSIHHYDARPIAHIPNSGEEFSSTTTLKNAAEPVGTR